jgi:hypothetical protein
MLCSIYGLKQSALEWYEQVRSVMANLGFVCTNSDHALFFYNEPEYPGELNTAVNIVHTHCLIGWHVDNGMAVCNSPQVLLLGGNTYPRGTLPCHMEISL